MIWCKGLVKIRLLSELPISIINRSHKKHKQLLFRYITHLNCPHLKITSMAFKRIFLILLLVLATAFADPRCLCKCCIGRRGMARSQAICALILAPGFVMRKCLKKKRMKKGWTCCSINNLGRMVEVWSKYGCAAYCVLLATEHVSCRLFEFLFFLFMYIVKRFFWVSVYITLQNLTLPTFLVVTVRWRPSVILFCKATQSIL